MTRFAPLIKPLLLVVVGFVFLATASSALAQSLTYQPLVGIPGVSNGAGGFNSYINQLYFLSISLAALLAVIKIIFGGVKWMLTDIVTSKADAKNEIKGALLGLLLIVSAVLILGTINPQLRELNVLGGAPALRGLPSANTEQYGPPAPPPPASAAAADLMVRPTVQEDGSTAPQVTLTPLRTETITANGVSQTVLVVSQADLENYNAGLRALLVQCQRRTPPGQVSYTNTDIKIEGETRIRPSTSVGVCR